MKRVLSLLLLCSLSFTSCIHAQSSYYSDIEGRKGGEELKTALHNIIKEVNTVQYGSGESRTWGAFYTTDAIEENGRLRVADMYSDNARYFGNKGDAVDGMNIEHCIAKSWWGGNENNAYRDLHHLNPSDQEANNRKANFPLAELSSVSWTNGVSSIGKANIAGTLQNAYEPADEYKGDFARTYMYMFTCYQNLKWAYTWMVYEQSNYPTLKPWAADLLLKWHREDPVSSKEVARNNEVYAIQGNRNPFIDYPRIADFIWGDSTDCTFHLYGGYEDGSGNQSGDDNYGDSAAGGEDSTDDESDKLGSDNFSLVTDVNHLNIGDTIIIVYNNVALSTEQRANNRGTANVQVSGYRINAVATDVQRIKIEQGNTAGTFAFNVGDGYLYAASSSSNYLRTQSHVDANASWEITISAQGAANITAQGNNTRNMLRYNKSAEIFSCYKSGQESVNIYAKSPANNSIASIDDSDKPVDVHDIKGTLVRLQIEKKKATEGLPSGTYIIDGQKYLIHQK